ncbi:MAG: amidophosphoribosyltransferase [Clostridiales bacterium]|nr:amidophosphoribosyltransferase [Clostridiales bacterium]
MSGMFGAVCTCDCVSDVFFGTDYHSHLGTRRAGMVFYDNGFQRSIHSIETAPFRSKFEQELREFHGHMGIGCISDLEPQPILIRSALGTFALATVGRVNNVDQLASMVLDGGSGHFFELSGGRINQTELVAALIARKQSMAEGIRYAQELIDGSMAILALTPEGIYAARDLLGRTPLMLGRKEGGHCVSFESFAYFNLDYEHDRELGPGEIVLLTEQGVTQLRPPDAQMQICSFLWIYFGYPTSCYEGVNVESMRYRCGGILAERETVEADSVSAVPDSGTAHAIGFANALDKPFQRPLIKYTPTWPRSFMPQGQQVRDMIARMKLAPIESLIRGKRLLLVDDSAVRGTQIPDTIGYLKRSGAAEVHMRLACPPILYNCKYLNFSRSSALGDLLGRRIIAEREGTVDPPAEVMARYLDPGSAEHLAMEQRAAEVTGVNSLRYQTVEGLERAIGLGGDCICTYCMNGRE